MGLLKADMAWLAHMHFIILMIGINYLRCIMCNLFSRGKQHPNREAVEAARSIYPSVCFVWQIV